MKALFALLVLALLACKTSRTDSSSTDAGAAPPTPTSASPTIAYVSTRDLERVCKGEPLEQAKAYDAARPGVHPTMVFLTKQEGSFFEKLDDKSLEEWQTKENRDYELVLCVTPTRTTTVETCNLETTEGSNHHLELQDASYDMVLYEAKTAKQVAKKSIALKVDRRCPSAWIFRHAGAQKRPDFLPTLISWSKRHVSPR